MSEKSVHLPQELVVEILLRLPVKTVLRCKCVCKSWLSLISNPHFATSHFQLAATPPTERLICLETFSNETISIDFNASFNDDSSYSSPSLDFLSGVRRPKIRGSCRGFLLLQYGTNFCIWNPSTGVHRQIPESLMASLSTDYFSRTLCGFAYEPSADDYLVVLGSNNYNVSYDSLIYVEVFSLKANKWKLIVGGSHFPCRISIDRLGLLLNNVIHWLVYNHETERYVISAFDLQEMRMSEIALPYCFDVSYISLIEYDLLVLGGLISALNMEKYTVEVWVLKDYADHSSWTKTLTLSMDSYFFPVCFTNCGNIIGTDGEGRLLKFNDKLQLLEHQFYCDIYFNRSHLVLYRESLL
ncbi:F-box/kelch-repeat protein At3g23880-like [Vicia villosa]|uniref:F-box/kelch-repeat protein At3g23880-like n=1 Tax=Vicia villosa TaxID=3911 RepID=UPI00273AF5CB|nr:F-box/kelch-repeat protein At3g23880-like [Vicia villosa]